MAEQCSVEILVESIPPRQLSSILEPVRNRVKKAKVFLKKKPFFGTLFIYLPSLAFLVVCSFGQKSKACGPQKKNTQLNLGADASAQLK